MADLIPAGEAVIQIRGRRREIFEKHWRDGQDNAFMDLAVNLAQMVALKLVDEKDIAVLYGIGTVINQKLLSAADGVVDLIAVVDMHAHGLVIVIQMGYGKILLGNAGVNGCLAGTILFHGTFPTFLFYFSCGLTYMAPWLWYLRHIIADKFRICKFWNKERQEIEFFI